MSVVADGLQARVVSNERDFLALQPEWNDLLDSSSSDCLFLTWEWLSLWWRHLGAGRRLFLLEVRHSGRLAGLAPFVAASDRLEFMGTGAVGSDYLDVLVRRDCRHEVLDALARELMRTNRPVVMSHILPGSDARFLAQQMRALGFQLCEESLNVCPFVKLDRWAWDDFLSHLGRRHRENVRRRLRKASDFRFVLTRTVEDLQRNFPVLLDLHGRRWIPRGGSDGLAGEDVIAFHREFSRLALQRGWLRLFVLHDGENPAAAVYAFHRKGKTLYYQAGVNPNYACWSPGLAALSLSIRHALEEGSGEFDFLHGDEDYKFLWTQEFRELFRARLYPDSFFGRMTLRRDQAMRAARKMARYVIPH